MRLQVFLMCILVVITACSEVPKVTPADQQYLFFPEEIKRFPVKNYQQMMAPDHKLCVRP